MACSYDLYLPEDTQIAVKHVLDEAGFEVRAKPKRLNGGGRGMEYDIRSGKDRVSVIEAPAYSTPKMLETNLRCSAAAKTAMLQSVVDTLKKAGAAEKKKR